MTKHFSLWLDAAHNECLEARLRERFAVGEFRFEPAARFDVTPEWRVGAVVAGAEGRTFEGFRWGLVPYWTQDLEDHHRMFHARAETLNDKPAFRYALSRQRCIVPATGFFEALDEESDPVRFEPEDGGFFALAGLWDEWAGPDGIRLRTCTLITTDANPLVAPLARRMPAILRPEDEATWLNPELRDASVMMSLLHPLAEKQMRATRFAAGSTQALEVLDEWDLRASSPQAAKRATSLYPARRLVRRDVVTPDGQIFFKTHSFTQRNATWWHPVVDVMTGEVFCDCPDFRYRHAKHEPHIATPQHWCKHLARAVENCRRHGELAV